MYLKQSKGDVKYGEHPNSGLMKIDFRNVDFLEDEFPGIGTKKLNYMSYNRTFNHLSVWGEFEFSRSHQELYTYSI